MLILYLLFGIAGMVISFKLVNRPTEIRFKVNSVDWCMPIFTMFVLFSFVFLLEVIVNDIMQTAVVSEMKAIWIILKLIDGGILIPFISVILSYGFGRLVEMMDLDLSMAYSDLLAKIAFSVIIVIHCVCFSINVVNNYSLEEPSVQSMINRIVIWFITFVGIWFSIGVACEGRIKRYKKNFTDSMKEPHNSENLSYYGAFWGTLLFISVVYIVAFSDMQNIQCLLMRVIHCIWFFAGGSIIVLYAAIWFTKPSQKRSDKILKRMIRRYKNGNQRISKKKYHYQNLSYSIVKKDKEYELIVLGREIIYSEMAEDDKELFDDKVFPIEQLNLEVIRDILEEIVKKRDTYLREQFEECRIAKRKELEKSDCI